MNGKENEKKEENGEGQGNWWRWRRYIAVALIASLALNLFLGGIAAHRLWTRYYLHQASLGRLFHALPEEVGDDFRQAMRQHRQKWQQQLLQDSEKIEASIEELSHILAADPYDGQRAATILQDIESSISGRGKRVMNDLRATLLNTFDQLTPAARKKLAEEMQDMPLFRNLRRHWHSHSHQGH